MFVLGNSWFHGISWPGTGGTFTDDKLWDKTNGKHAGLYVRYTTYNIFQILHLFENEQNYH